MQSFQCSTDISTKTLTGIKRELTAAGIAYVSEKSENNDSLTAFVTRAVGISKVSFKFTAKKTENGVSVFCSRTDGLSHGFSKGDSALSQIKIEAEIRNNGNEAYIQFVQGGGIAYAPRYAGYN